MFKTIAPYGLLIRQNMIRKGGMVTVNPFGEAWRRKMNTKPTGPVHFGPFEVTPQVSRRAWHLSQATTRKTL